MLGWSDAIKYCNRFCDDNITDFTDFDRLFTNNDKIFVSSLGNHILHFASAGSSSSILKYLISKQVGNFVNCKNNKGESVLHIACLTGCLENIKILINAGANIRTIDLEGNNILHFACTNRQPKIVKYLALNYPILLKEKNTRNQTPLAVACDNHNLETVKILLENGSHIGSLLFYYSLKNNFDIVEIFLHYQNEFNTTDKDKNNRTPLHYSVLKNHYRITKLLLNIPRYVKEKDNEGYTPQELLTCKISNPKLLSLFE